MFLSKLILAFYEPILEVSIWLSLLGFFLAGWRAYGIVGAIISLIGALIFITMTTGFLLTLLDIRRLLKKIESTKNL
ncbi:MAG: hypothetical protein ACFBSE_03200 [Prochloraceae cyanobacterium]